MSTRVEPPVVADDTDGYKYLVEFKIDVKRTDGKMLTNDENSMVQVMQAATHEAIAKVMSDYGQNKRKHLKDEIVAY